jgi:hypothetical protein
MLCDRSMLLNLEKNIFTLITLLNTQCVDDDDAIAGNDNACSFVWGISGGSNAIDSFHGTIGSIPWLGSGGGGKEGSQNMGGAEAIWGGQKIMIKCPL